MQYKKIPEALNPEHLTFLDDLRESGITNMYGSGPHLIEAFPDLTRSDAISIVTHWMDTFAIRHQDKDNESKPEAE